MRRHSSSEKELPAEKRNSALLPMMRCFVAMAFDRSDTDALYDRSIAPILRDYGVIPIRVDRLQHNDDLDDRIIAEIQNCDFLLADLTYARPSVYFEAGYGQRQVSVIYTSRRDHLSPRPNDEHGNFRVHFDLQMKNIICWSGPADKAFQKKLAGRVAHVIAPIMRKREREQRERNDIDYFASLPVTQRMERLASECISLLEERAYRREDSSCRHPSVRYSPSGAKFVGAKTVNTVLQAVFVFMTPSITKTWLRWELSKAISEEPLYDLNAKLEKRALSRLVEHLFICSLQKVPLSKIMSMLPNFRLDAAVKELELDRNQIIPKGHVAGFSPLYFHRSLGGEPRFVGWKQTPEEDESWINLSIAGQKLIDPSGRTVGYAKVVPRHTHIRIFDDIKSAEALTEEFSVGLAQVESEVF